MPKNYEKQQKKDFYLSMKYSFMGIIRTGIQCRFQKTKHTLVTKCTQWKLEDNEVFCDLKFSESGRKMLTNFFGCTFR